jgi:hypothetical protein
LDWWGLCGLSLESQLLLNALAENPLWTVFGVIIIYAIAVKQFIFTMGGLSASNRPSEWDNILLTF